MTIEEIEKKEHDELRKCRPDWIGTERDVPFGLIQHRWEEFKKQIMPGDSLEWYDDIGPLCGSAGYKIVRQGVTIDYFGTILS